MNFQRRQQVTCFAITASTQFYLSAEPPCFLIDSLESTKSTLLVRRLHRNLSFHFPRRQTNMSKKSPRHFYQPIFQYTRGVPKVRGKIRQFLTNSNLFLQKENF